MNGNYLLMNFLRFCLFVSLQIAVFSRIEIFGTTAFPYLLFLVLYPINTNRYGFLFASFLVGLTIDMFLDSGGIHTTSCLIVAFFRENLFKVSFGLSYQYQIIRIGVSPFGKQLNFVGLLTIIHHLILFYLEVFSMELFAQNFLKLLVSIILTATFSLLLINLFKSSQR